MRASRSIKRSIAPFAVNVPSGVDRELLRVIHSGFIGQGKQVEKFEKQMADTFGLRNVVAVNSGTAALRLALALADVGPGDEVVTTPYTMVATNTAILEQFAKPVFADIQQETANIDPFDVEKKITSKTKAIMCVHWGGYPCDMKELMSIGRTHKLPVIEDAAHALGAVYRGRPAGLLGDYGAFSFQAIKLLTTGDGGMLIAKKKSKQKEAGRRRWFGIDRTKRKKAIGHDPVGDIKELGYKYHMNDIAATLGLSQLGEVKRVLRHRRSIAELYRKGLEDVRGIELLENGLDRQSANWMFAVRVLRGRTGLVTFLQNRGVGATVHNFRNDRYSVFGGKREDLPNLVEIDKSLMNLPVHHLVTIEDVEFIVEQIKKYAYKKF